MNLTEQIIDILRLHGSVSWSDDKFGMICDGCLLRVQGVGLASHQTDLINSLIQDSQAEDTKILSQIKSFADYLLTLVEDDIIEDQTALQAKWSTAYALKFILDGGFDSVVEED